MALANEVATDRSEVARNKLPRTGGRTGGGGVAYSSGTKRKRMGPMDFVSSKGKPVAMAMGNKSRLGKYLGLFASLRPVLLGFCDVVHFSESSRQRQWLRCESSVSQGLKVKAAPQSSAGQPD